MTDPSERLAGSAYAASGSGSQDWFLVEARLDYSEPRSVAGHMLDDRWRRLDFPRSLVGVPCTSTQFGYGAADHGMMNIEAAEALRWWFLAQAEADRIGGSLCVETRIVKVCYHYTFRCEEIGVSAAVTSSEQRREMTFELRQSTKPAAPAG